jgi:cytochrome c oxidase subunit 2
MNPPLLTTTQAVDPVFIWIVGISVVLLLGITAVTIWFVIRYRRSRTPEPTSLAAGNVWIEITWVSLSTLLVLAMFYYGWAGYLALRNVPKGALQVTATARMWFWSFTYANGKTSPRLYVPVGRPVEVNIVSLDVLHGFYIPAFRVKRDAVPGMKNHAWFVASRAGSYDLFCSSYCGIGHSGMVTTVEAVPEAVFMAWLQERKPARAKRGMEVLEKYGCLACHSLDGTKKAGPTFKGIWGHQATVVTNGAERTVTVDEPYLRRSLEDPNADLVKGYQPIMPKFTQLTRDEMEAFIDVLKESKGQ